MEGDGGRARARADGRRRRGGVRSAESVLPPGQSGFVPPRLDAEPAPDRPGRAVRDLRLQAGGLRPARRDRDAARRRDDHARRLRRAERARRHDGRLWFGAGYAVAQDRLVELELFRRATQGRLAEILGKTRLEDDIVARRDYYTRAECAADAAGCPATLRARFDAYADGVNAWIARVTADPRMRPREFALLGLTPAPWTVLDSAAIGVQLARTVPVRRRPRARELARAAALGAKRFDRFLPLRRAGQPATVPASEGRFPSQPGRSRADERRGYKALAALLEGAQASEGRRGRGAGGRAAARARRLVPVRAARAGR